MNAHTQERILKYSKMTNSLSMITSQLGKGYTDMKIASAILTMSRKGLIAKEKATRLLVDFPNIAKFLNYELGSNCVGAPQGKAR